MNECLFTSYLATTKALLYELIYLEGAHRNHVRTSRTRISEERRHHAVDWEFSSSNIWGSVFFKENESVGNFISPNLTSL